MRQLLHVTLRPARCHVAGHRIHHGLTGLLVALVGVGLIYDDRHDWRVWVSDLLTRT